MVDDHIFKYDKTGKYLSHFGTMGNGLKQFNTAHGMTLDTRYTPPRLLICCRSYENSSCPPAVWRSLINGGMLPHKETRIGWACLSPAIR